MSDGFTPLAEQREILRADAFLDDLTALRLEAVEECFEFPDRAALFRGSKERVSTNLNADYRYPHGEGAPC